MRRIILVATALTALTATPAMARDHTHISFGFYQPAPVIYPPAPVYYAPRVAYVAPMHRPCPPRQYGWERRHHRHHNHHNYAWNDGRSHHDYWR